MLKIQLKEPYETTLWIVDKNFSIGRQGTNNLAIDDDSVSAKHAQVTKLNGKYILKDLNSSSGTFVNGLKISEANIACFDVLRFGDIEVQVIDPQPELDARNASWSLVATKGTLAGREFFISSDSDSPITLGRGRKCDISIPGTQLAKEHIELKLAAEALQIKDLGAITGTYVNGERVKEAELKAGDSIRMDILSFTVFGPGYPMPISENANAEDNEPVVIATSPQLEPEAVLDKKIPDSLLDSTALDELIGDAPEQDEAQFIDEESTAEEDTRGKEELLSEQSTDKEAPEEQPNPDVNEEENTLEEDFSDSFNSDNPFGSEPENQKSSAPLIILGLLLVTAIANGASNNLIERAADVALKERSQLIVVPREAPYSTIHLENMLKLSRLGVTVLPASPGFYQNPKSIEDLVDFVVARILDQLGVKQRLLEPWGH